MTNTSQMDRIECRIGTHVSTLLMLTKPCVRDAYNPRNRTTTKMTFPGGQHVDPKAARRVVTAWKRPEFNGARFKVFYTSGAIQDATLNDVCTIFDVTPSSRKSDSVRVVPVAAIQAAPAPTNNIERKEDPKMAKIKELKTEIAKIENKGKPKRAPAYVAPASTDLRPNVYTVGYDAGLTPAGLLAIMGQTATGAIVDTRANLNARAPGWSSAALEKFIGPGLYSVAQTLSDVCLRVARLPDCILLRKEEAPGDNAFHLEIAKALQATCNVRHFFRNEIIEAAELQRAIDDGDEYECEIKEGPAQQAQAAG